MWHLRSKTSEMNCQFVKCTIQLNMKAVDDYLYMKILATPTNSLTERKKWKVWTCSYLYAPVNDNWRVSAAAVWSPVLLMLPTCSLCVPLLLHSEKTFWMKWRAIKIIQNHHIVFCQLSRLNHLCAPHITSSASKHTSSIMGTRLVCRAQFREGEQSSNNYNSLCMCMCVCVCGNITTVTHVHISCTNPLIRNSCTHTFTHMQTHNQWSRKTPDSVSWHDTMSKYTLCICVLYMSPGECATWLWTVCERLCVSTCRPQVMNQDHNVVDMILEY